MKFLKIIQSPSFTDTFINIQFHIQNPQKREIILYLWCAQLGFGTESLEI